MRSIESVSEHRVKQINNHTTTTKVRKVSAVSVWLAMFQFIDLTSFHVMYFAPVLSNLPAPIPDL